MTQKTTDAYEALEQAEEGDRIDFTPHELTEAICKKVMFDTHIIQTSTEKNNDGLQHVMLFNPKSKTHRFVLGRYGHNDRAVDRGFDIVQTGDSINAELNNEIDTDAFEDIELSDEDEEKLVTTLKENLVESETVISDMIVDSWFDSIYMNNTRVDFNARSNQHYYAPDRQTENFITELEDKYGIENLHLLIQIAIHSDTDKMFSYDIKLE